MSESKYFYHWRINGLDVYKRQVEDEPLDTLYTTKRYTKVSSEHYQTVVEGCLLYTSSLHPLWGTV